MFYGWCFGSTCKKRRATHRYMPAAKYQTTRTTQHTHFPIYLFIFSGSGSYVFIVAQHKKLYDCCSLAFDVFPFVDLREEKKLIKIRPLIYPHKLSYKYVHQIFNEWMHDSLGLCSSSSSSWNNNNNFIFSDSIGQNATNTYRLGLYTDIVSPLYNINNTFYFVLSKPSLKKYELVSHLRDEKKRIYLTWYHDQHVWCI